MTQEPTAPQRDIARTGRLGRIRAYGLLWSIGLLVFACDQLSKSWIAAKLPFPTYGHPGAIEVIPDFFNLVHVGNTGAAWSILSGKSYLLALVAIVTLGGIYLWRKALGLKSLFVQFAFGLLCGGIVGNLVDRLMHGHVIDFLDFHFGSYIYPTFNIADIGICVGVGLYLLHSLRHPES